MSLRVVSKVPDGVSKGWWLETPQSRSGRDTGRRRLQLVVDSIPYTYRVNRGVLVDTKNNEDNVNVLMNSLQFDSL